MNTINKAFAVAGALLALSWVPALAAQKAAPEAAIVNTGSTNTRGYVITVWPSGYTSLGWPNSVGESEPVVGGRIKKSLAQKLFHDIKAAQPLNQLPVEHRMKSASFGTSTYIEYNGQKTPDLSSPGDLRGQALLTDIQNIAAALNLKNGPRRPVGPIPPAMPQQ